MTKKIELVNDIEMLADKDKILALFPNFDYRKCISPERLDYRRLDNVVGWQQRAFLVYWAVKMCEDGKGTGIEFGAGGINTPFVINTDKYGDNSHMRIDAESDEDLNQFQNGEFDLILASHLIEHLSVDIETLFHRHWLRILKHNGIVAGIIPDDQYGDTMSYDPTHRQHWSALEFRKILERMDKAMEILEYDNLNNHFSFNFVAKRR